jgi:hypothetical protein
LVGAGDQVGNAKKGQFYGKNSGKIPGNPMFMCGSGTLTNYANVRSCPPGTKNGADVEKVTTGGDNARDVSEIWIGLMSFAERGVVFDVCARKS